jgi:ABC-type transport system involved in multi-copper enzyme maturation permease subunit
MFQQTLAIIRNTFFESIRQPIMLVVLVAATVALILANPLSAFTMENDQRMFIDIGLATVFLCGCLLAAFIATNVLGREIENRTALTVISKPVPRVLFVIGKYLGVAAAISLGAVYMALVFMLADLHSVLQTVRDPLHLPVILFSFLAGVIGLGVAVWCNYFYGKVFTSTVIAVTTPLAALAYLFALMFRPDFALRPISEAFKGQLWLGIIALWVAIMVLTAIALAASTRFGQVMTLLITIGVFLMGMLSDWMFARPMLSLGQTWTQRVSNLTPDQVEQHLGADQTGRIRAWTTDVYSQQAYHDFSTWLCRAHMQVTLERNRLREMTHEQRLAAIKDMEDRSLASKSDELANDLAEARRRAESLPTRPAGRDLVLTLDWPLSVQRPDWECELIANTRTFTYPPAERAVASGTENATYLACRVAGAIVPNFQVMFLSDALTQNHIIPVRYVLTTMLYGLLYIGAALALAVCMFQTREVG